ncbi:UNVERIFIED_CONTAM: hypothetical protein Sangu_3204100 [Sesamum angustifolium]|uniref:Reverse transcriptase domain-containing protein n=1 Tax=Sesamum angustifolium TaxID=2727405 RepID=A0AAW2JNB5_9LAMI
MLPSSPNSLSSLTHTTHTAPSDLHAAPTSSPVDKPDGLIEEADPGGESDILEGESTGKLSGDFDFEEFYDLATRVLNGDSDSLANLNSLKVRWEQKFNTRRNPTLKSVTGRPSTPFRPRISMLPRRVLRTGLGPQEQGPQDTEINQEGVAPHPIEGLVDSEVKEGRDSGINRENPDCPSEMASHLPLPVQDDKPSPRQVIYVGNVKLQAGPVDNIAGAFLQSSRKTLHFVPPTRQNGEVIIRRPRKWSTMVPRYGTLLLWAIFWDGGRIFLSWNHLPEQIGKDYMFLLLLASLLSFSAGSRACPYDDNNTLMFRFWIRLKHLPMEYWTEEGLSTVASGIGTPLYSDGITKDCSRLDYARVCVMLNYNSDLPKHLVVISPVLRNGKEDPKRVDVEYEWLPQKCSNCCSLGHVETVCPANSMKKTIAPPIKVFVKKRSVAHSEQNTEVAGAANLVCNNSRPSELGKGKAIALYNSYGALDTVSDEENDAQLSGPNQRSPTVEAHDQAGLVEFVDDSEVCGRAADTSASMLEFRTCIRDTGLVQLPVSGCPYTWHNCSEGMRSLWKRLDRMLVNTAWLDAWPNSSYICALPSTSDHSPLILSGMNRFDEHVAFRFDNYLTHLPGFLRSVEDIWKHRIAGTAMYETVCKLKLLKAVFRSQKRMKGNLTENVTKAKSFLDKAQALLNTYNEDIFLNLVKCCRSQNRGLNLEFLRSELKHSVTTTEASLLVAPVTQAEVKEAFFDIDVESAPGPDGYTAAFYRTAWPVVGQAVFQAVGEFFRTGNLLKQINTTLIVLIPKVNLPIFVSDYRPISCCNVLYKAITKILVKRMQRVLPLLIDYSQNAFVPGRSIIDNVLLAQELMAGYNQRRLPQRCTLKVDIQKAYDSVEWDFLLRS